MNDITISSKLICCVLTEGYMPAPQEVTNLVERFHFNLKDYRAGIYNETQVRLKFIDPSHEDEIAELPYTLVEFHKGELPKE